MSSSVKKSKRGAHKKSKAAPATPLITNRMYGAALAARGVELPASSDAQALLAHLNDICGNKDLIGYSLQERAALFAGIASLIATPTLTKKAGDAVVRVYDPMKKRHGWNRPCTVIEIRISERPFVVDSVCGGLTDAGYIIQELMYTAVWVKRDRQGRLREIAPTQDKTAKREDFCHIQVDPSQDIEALTAFIISILKDVQAATNQWLAMRDGLAKLVGEDETGQLAQWLLDDHFILIGMRDYQITQKDAPLVAQKGGLGILADPARPLIQVLEDTPLPPMAFPIILSGDEISTVHRRVPLDVILFAVGKKIRAFAGLFTWSSHRATITNIPMIRERIDQVYRMLALSRHSHMGKQALTLMDDLPRDELFQRGPASLSSLVGKVVSMRERALISLSLRDDPFDRFTSVLLYAPRENWTTDVRFRVQEVLEAELKGQVRSFGVYFGEGTHMRASFIVGRDGTPRKVDEHQLEETISHQLIDWKASFQRTLLENYEAGKAAALYRRFRRSFLPSYTQAYQAAEALQDLPFIDAVQSESLAMRFHVQEPGVLQVKLYHRDDPIVLAQVLPIFSNFGLAPEAHNDYRIKDGDQRIWLHDFRLRLKDQGDKSAGDSISDGVTNGAELVQAFKKVYAHDAIDDEVNSLIFTAGISHRQIRVLRGYIHYLRQIGAIESKQDMVATLARHGRAVAILTDLIDARFNPKGPGKDARTHTQETLDQDFNSYLAGVTDIIEDQNLSRLRDVIKHTVRTSFYAVDETKPMAFKIQTQNLPYAPQPRPWREIFVHGIDVDGCHLRESPVARGGLRYSERPADFRSEILGLLRAQIVKNTVIVPGGAKGGFIINRGGDSPERVRECYTFFINALLDITDNRVANKIVRPPQVICWDDPDPYLVVAADKGTATFSDTACDIALERGFWLGDAFASGGSAGYDHKKMGITARGAWESVKRHFREMDHDVAREPFRVIGVGDMAGDVFGNGMLCSKQICLVAAFNHKHIFLDPDPDPATSYKIREKLFKSRGGWDAYPVKSLSPGGGIFLRTDKSIPLSAPVRKLLGLEASKASSDDVIRAILKSEVDLLWFGGIGTYIKHAVESHPHVADKANDSIRIDAHEVRARVIGEGANLGVSQSGRAACALAGVRLNTDFVDNSAGVDCSDHEVNIKILLAGNPIGRNIARRNKLLESMTDDVAAACLRNNYLQTQTLSIAEREARPQLSTHIYFIRELERVGLLDRQQMAIPSDENLIKQGRLTRPELAALLCSAKRWLAPQILDSNLVRGDALSGLMIDYFPDQLGKLRNWAVKNHMLRDHIRGTLMTNDAFNRLGISGIFSLSQTSRRALPEIINVYWLVRQALGLDCLYKLIESQDQTVATELIYDMMLMVQRTVLRCCRFLLRTGVGREPITEKQIGAYARWVNGVSSVADTLLPEAAQQVVRQRIAHWREQNIDIKVARPVALFNITTAGIDLANLGQKIEKFEFVAHHYFYIGQRFMLAHLREIARAIDNQDIWTRMSLNMAVDDLYLLQADITRESLQEGTRKWGDKHRTGIEAVEQLLGEIMSTPTIDLTMVMLVTRRIREMLIWHRR
ncbi:MAG: NAD-glutamate dehydrogenase domain-containing protein [Pseudomonadota bacterium]